MSASVPPECAPFLDDLPELALGILTGRARAETLAHVDSCPACATELERLSRAADALLEAVPSVDPPVGFEVRVHGRLGLHAPRRVRRRRVTLAWSGAIVGALGAFMAGLFLAPDRAGSPTVANVAAVRSAEITASSKTIGVAVAYAGPPAWLTMSVDGLKTRGEVACWGRTKSGKTIELGQFWLASGSGIWSMRLPTAPANLVDAYLTAPSGTVVGEASFGPA